MNPDEQRMRVITSDYTYDVVVKTVMGEPEQEITPDGMMRMTWTPRFETQVIPIYWRPPKTSPKEARRAPYRLGGQHIQTLRLDESWLSAYLDQTLDTAFHQPSSSTASGVPSTLATLHEIESWLDEKSKRSDAYQLPSQQMRSNPKAHSQSRHLDSPEGKRFDVPSTRSYVRGRGAMS